MVMHIVDQRNIRGFAERQQVGGRENLVVVLHGQPRPNPRGEPVEIPRKIVQRLAFISIRPASVNIHDICVDPLRHFGLVFKLLDRFIDNVGTWRIQHDELVRMKTGSHFLLTRQFAALFETLNDRLTVGQLFHAVSALRMRLQRQDLTVHSKAPDLMSGTVLDRSIERVGIVATSAYGHHTKTSLSLAYVQPQLAKEGTKLTVEICGKMCAAHIVPEVFYDPNNDRLKA